LLKYEYNFNKGVFNGKLELWNREGRLIAHENYINGELSGYRYVNYLEGISAYGFDHFISHYFREDDYTSGVSEDEILSGHYIGSEIVTNRYRIIDDSYSTMVPHAPLVFGTIQEFIYYPVYPDLESEEYVEEIIINEYPIDCELIESLNYKNGLLHGKQTYWKEKNAEHLNWSWDENDQNVVFYKFCEENYINNKKDGLQYKWDINGILIEIENFNNGEKNGLQKYGDIERGKLSREENYSNGKKDGVQRNWNDRGDLVVEENYKLGELHGAQFEIREDWGNDAQGYNYLIKTHTESNYWNGLLHGEQRYWEDGQCIWAKNYLEGVLNGESRYYTWDKILSYIYLVKTYKKGSLEKVTACDEWGEQIVDFEENYEEGKRNGLFKYNMKESIYCNDIRNGLTRGWYDNNQLKFEIEYTNDKPNGKCRVWYESGKLKEEWTYSNGILHGQFKIYSEKDKIITTGFVENNSCKETVCKDIDGKIIDTTIPPHFGLQSEYLKDFFPNRTLF